MRKTRRKIKRRKRGKKRHRKRICRMDAPITNSFTRFHTWFIDIIEVIFVLICGIWASFEIFMQWQDFIARLKKMGVF